MASRPSAARHGATTDATVSSHWEKVREELRLSRRELDVLRRLCVGDSEKQVAAHLRLSPATVHTHLQRMHSKLGVHTRSELLLLALGVLNER